MRSCSTSSTVASEGMLTVLEMAPDRNGCTAAIMATWPELVIGLSPSEQANTSACSGASDEPSMLWCSTMWAVICSVCWPL